MNIILVLIPVSLVLVVIAVLAFFWAVGSGQFDDLDSPAYRILFDDDEPSRERHKPDAEDDAEAHDNSSDDRER